MRRIAAADDVNGWRVCDADLAAEIFVGVNLGGEFTLRIDHEWQVGFVLSGKLLRDALQVVRRNFRLVLEDVITELIAEIFGLAVEIPRDHSRIKGPVVHGQRKVVPDEWNLVRFGSLLLERRVSTAFRALQVLKHNQRDRSAFWGMQ